jgi:RNA polymerase sigma factor (sigma-70 family)
MMSDDMALVREYARSDSEQAFATLVSRYVNLVYSVALRQVRDPHLAEEITQGVFIILARKAKSLSPKTILSGWLCRTARNVSADTLKIQRRRQSREQESQMQSSFNEPEPGVWNEIAPMLDEALGCLGEKEHDAVVLRFFDGKELKQVGAAMSIGEDAARMRVNRGVEQLREFFTKKGVTLSAATITGAVAANSVQAAPAGLAASITAAALSGTAITTAAVVAATKGIAMTSLQKTLITTVFAAAVGTGIYEARQAANARAELQTLQQQQAPLADQIKQLQDERDEATNRFTASLANDQSANAELLKLRGEVARLRLESQQLAKLKAGEAGQASKSLVEEAESLIDRVRRLKERVEQTPAAKIPELQFLTDEDWLRAAAAQKRLETDEQFQAAFSDLRDRAEGRFLMLMETPLRKYIEANNNQFPTDLSQLKPYLERPPGDDILQRYEIVPANSLPAASAMRDAGDWLIRLKSNFAEETENVLGRNGFSTFVNSEPMTILARAMRALAEDAPEVDGKKTMDIHQLVPYLKTPEEKAAYERLTGGDKPQSK